MPRKPTGNVYLSAGTWYARVTVDKGKRPSFALPWCRDEERARERLVVLAELASKLRTAGLAELAPEYLERAAIAEGRGLDVLRRAVEQLVARGVERRAFRATPPAAALCVEESIRRPPLAPGVYFVRMGDYVKIGVARNVRARLAALQTSSPEPLVLLAVFRDGTAADELRLHQRFEEHRVRGEWFTLCPDIMAEIEQIRRHPNGEV